MAKFVLAETVLPLDDAFRKGAGLDKFEGGSLLEALNDSFMRTTQLEDLDIAQCYVEWLSALAEIEAQGLGWVFGPVPRTKAVVYGSKPVAAPVRMDLGSRFH